MKTILKINILIISLILMMVNPMSGKKDSLFDHQERGVYLQLSGGAGFMQGGDFIELIEKNLLYADYQNRSTVRDPFFWNYTGEVRFCFGKFSLGVETGYLVRSFELGGDRVESDEYQRWKFSAIPILANLHYRIIKNSVFTLYGKAGFGLYLGALNETASRPGYGETYTFEEKSVGSMVGIHGGLVLEVRLTGSLCLVVETRVRQVNFKGLDGEGNSSYSGDYSGVLHYRSPPDGEGAFFNLGEAPGYRFAEISLNGISTHIGLRLKL